MLLLISIYDRPLLQVVQTEQFAGEIIRTLVGSIGLVLAVPLTTAVGVAVVRASQSAVAPERRMPRPRPVEAEPVAAEELEPVGGRGSGPRSPDRATWGPIVGGREPSRSTRKRLSQPSRRRSETSVLPATKWRDLPRTGNDPREPPRRDLPRRQAAGPAGPSRTGSTPAGTAPASGRDRRRHRSRRRDDDDFGDFTYLREPEDTDPGPLPTRARVPTPVDSNPPRPPLL